MSRQRGLLVAALAALFLLGSLTQIAAAAPRSPSGSFVPGVVDPPPLGLALHGDVIRREDDAKISVGAADKQQIKSADGYRVWVETSLRYEPDLEYDEGLVGFLESLDHGSELGSLRVYVAVPGEMASLCGGLAAACYVPDENRIFIVGEANFGGFPTSYALAHEYGHRIEDYRHNPPFPGGPLLWGTKRWASVKGVCRGTVEGKFAPGNEAGRYFENPGEAFAETYAWSRFGPGIVEWRWAPALHPSATAYAALRRDILDPWKPLRSERQGRVTSSRPRHTYRLRPKNDGWLHVAMTGNGSGSDLDLGLLDARGRLLAAATRPATSQEHLNFLVCGERRLKLVVLAVGRPGSFQLRIEEP